MCASIWTAITTLNANDFLGDLLKILITFIFTSVIGGYLTSQFQKKNWEHQRKLLKLERYDEQATKIFEDISSILDQRMFRYRQIIYAFRTEDEKRIETAFQEYRDVLFRWNDHINRNYAMVEKFFGKEVREELEYKINKDVIFIGTLLERIKKKKENAIDKEEVWKKIDDLNARVYLFDTKMLEIISRKSEKLS